MIGKWCLYYKHVKKRNKLYGLSVRQVKRITRIFLISAIIGFLSGWFKQNAFEGGHRQLTIQKLNTYQ